MHKQQIIQQLQLEPHVEGGYFRRTYQSATKVAAVRGERWAMTSIYYLLTDDSPIGYLHRNQSDIVHYFHGGSPLTYWTLAPGGQPERRVLGPGLADGQQLQLIVPGGHWKATELENGSYGLLSEAVAPGFDYADMELATMERLRGEFPRCWEKLARFIKPQPG